MKAGRAQNAVALLAQRVQADVHRNALPGLAAEDAQRDDIPAQTFQTLLLGSRKSPRLRELKRLQLVFRRNEALGNHGIGQRIQLSLKRIGKMRPVFEIPGGKSGKIGVFIRFDDLAEGMKIAESGIDDLVHEIVIASFDLGHPGSQHLLCDGGVLSRAVPGHDILQRGKPEDRLPDLHLLLRGERTLLHLVQLKLQAQIRHCGLITGNGGIRQHFGVKGMILEADMAFRERIFFSACRIVALFDALLGGIPRVRYAGRTHRIFGVEPQHVVLAGHREVIKRFFPAGRIGVQHLDHGLVVPGTHGKAGFDPVDLPLDLPAHIFVLGAVLVPLGIEKPGVAGSGGVQLALYVAQKSQADRRGGRLQNGRAGVIGDHRIRSGVLDVCRHRSDEILRVQFVALIDRNRMVDHFRPDSGAIDRILQHVAGQGPDVFCAEDTRKSERDPLLGIFGHIVGSIDLRGQIHQFSSPLFRIRLRTFDAAPLGKQLFTVAVGCLLKPLCQIVILGMLDRIQAVGFGEDRLGKVEKRPLALRKTVLHIGHSLAQIDAERPQFAAVAGHHVRLRHVGDQSLRHEKLVQIRFQLVEPRPVVAGLHAGQSVF